MKLSLKQRETIAFMLMIAGLMISFMRGGHDMLMMGIGAALTIISIVLYIVLVRCPYCGAWLGIYSIIHIIKFLFYIVCIWF